MKAYNAMVEDYKKNEVNFTIATKQEKQKAILEAENNLGTFQKNGTKLISIRRDELLRPLYQKIGDALGKTAKANAYTQVLQINDSLVYIDNEYDLTIEVLAELGVEIETKN
jgi:outer membrane protein